MSGIARVLQPGKKPDMLVPQPRDDPGRAPAVGCQLPAQPARYASATSSSIDSS